MTAGDQGVQLVCDSNGYNMTGATVTLIAAPRSPQKGASVRLSPLTVADDGLTADYITTGTDFTVGGQWFLQLEVVPSVSGEKFTSPEVPFWVYPHL